MPGATPKRQSNQRLKYGCRRTGFVEQSLRPCPRLWKAGEPVLPATARRARSAMAAAGKVSPAGALDYEDSTSHKGPVGGRPRRPFRHGRRILHKVGE